MKKKKHISEEPHYLCEIGLEKMPYRSSWLYKSYTEESLTHITITAYYTENFHSNLGILLLCPT